jgi:hypothetical protein
MTEEQRERRRARQRVVNMTDAQKERQRAKHRRWYTNNRDKKLERTRLWRAQNVEQVKEYNRQWRNENREIYLEKVREYQSKNPDVVKRCNSNYYAKHSNKLKEYQVEYSKANRNKINARSRRYVQQRIKTDLQFRITHVLRSRLCAAIKGRKPVQQTMDLVGISFTELISYLEGRFQHGMSWANYGFRGWHVDHIAPIASFDLTDPDQQRRCFHYTNLQPLWWKDNLRKKHSI